MAPLASMESLSTTPDFSALPGVGGVGQVVGGAMSVVSGRKSAATVAPDAVSTSSMMVAHKTFEPPGLGKPSRVTPLGLDEGKLSASDHKRAKDGWVPIPRSYYLRHMEIRAWKIWRMYLPSGRIFVQFRISVNCMHAGISGTNIPPEGKFLPSVEPFFLLCFIHTDFY